MDIVYKNKVVSVPILPIVAGLVLAVFLVSSMRIGTIGASEIGVFVNNLTGGVEVDTQPGARVYNALFSDFSRLDNTVQTLRMARDQGSGREIDIKTSDGSDVKLDVELNYRLLQDPATIRDRVIPESGVLLRDASYQPIDGYKQKWVKDYARSVIRYVFGELTTDQFYEANERDKKARESEAELNRLLADHGLQVLKVVPEGFEFYAEYEDIIARKKAADQEVDSQLAKADAARQSQQLRMTEATAKANVEIARLRGELEKLVLQIQADAARETKAAEAYAYSTKTAADAEFYRVSNEAEALLATSKAEAEGLRRLAESLAGPGAENVVKMRYAEALRNARIQGVPYATDPRIQKVEIGPAPNSGSFFGGANR